MNTYIQNYRAELAKAGRVDDRPDDILTWEEGEWAKQNAPDLFERYPDFAEQFYQIREANAPGLVEEGTRAFKRAGIGLGSTALGGAALVTGSDYLKRKAAALQMQASDPDLASTIPTLEDIRSPRDLARYATAKVGEAVPSIGEAVTLGLVGGAIGSAIEPGAGTIAGVGAGAVEGLIGRGIIRKAIKSLVAEGITEEALIAGLRKGVPAVVEAVTKNAKSLAGARAGTVTAGLNSFLLNAGDVYSENDDRGIAAALGLVAAVPDMVVPAIVIRQFFPKVSLSAGREAMKEVVGSNALKVMKAAGVTAFESGTESFQQAVNVVARNLKAGRDPLSFNDRDLVEIREAGITGAVGGALASPAIAFERDQEVIDQPIQQDAVVPPPAVTPLAPPPSVAVTLLPTQRVRAMTPEQQVQRLTELDAKEARTADEEKEYQILMATVASRPAEPALAEPAAVAPAIVAPQITLPPPADVAGSATPIPGADVVPVAARPISPAALPIAPAVFVGLQEGFGDVPSFNLYNLTEDIPGHPAGSTVSQDTLEQAGFVAPPAVEQPAVPATPIAAISQPLTPVTDALPQQIPTALDVLAQPENGSPLGEGNAVVPEPAGAGEAAVQAQAVLADQIVKIPAKRAKTGEMIEVEMTAKKAEKLLTSRVEVMQKLLTCLAA